MEALMWDSIFASDLVFPPKITKGALSDAIIKKLTPKLVAAPHCSIQIIQIVHEHRRYINPIAKIKEPHMTLILNP